MAYSPLHEDPGVAHVGGCRVGDGHRLCDALVFEVANRMDVRSSDEGCESAKVGSNVGAFELLDGSHNGGGHKKGGTMMMEGRAKGGRCVGKPKCVGMRRRIN